MTRTFSSPSESLGYFVGFAFLHYDNVALISPWISDIEINFPVSPQTEETQQMYLSEAIEKFGDDTRIRMLIREDQSHNSYIKSQMTGMIEIELVDDLHAKAIVTPELVYVGSANITRGGLHINRELCQINENEYKSVNDYIREELNL